MIRSNRRSFEAKNPHCGVCQHVYFRGDWDRTPYCAQKDRPTEIRVGDICEEFQLRNSDNVATDPDLEIDWTDRTSGTAAPFYAAYRDDRKYSHICGNCRSLNVAVDPMGRIECTECGNKHKPTDWDAAYL